jgi:hypothetical protein
MTADHLDGQATVTSEPYQALLAVSEAIVSHRDLSALFHELAGRLHQVVRFDYLAIVLHEEASNTLCLHVLEPPEPTLLSSVTASPVGETSGGFVWRPSNRSSSRTRPSEGADRGWRSWCIRMESRAPASCR